MEKILLDTDIGSDVDDALALLFALKSPDISVEGVTTVYGKTNLRAKIAQKIIDYAGCSIPVYAGESTPIRTGYPIIWHTGREGEGILDDVEMYTNKLDIKENAVDFLIEKIMNNPKEMNLVTIGALTNIAKVFTKEPKTQDYLKHIYIMGGSIAFPEEFQPNKFNYNTNPEHNINCDIDAAQIVFNSRTAKTILPIDVTAKTPILRDEFNYLKDIGELEKSVGSLVDVWFNYRDDVFEKHVEYTCMHDPLTVAAINHPYLLKSVKVPISVNNDGNTKIIQSNEEENNYNKVNLCYDVDQERFKKLFLDTINGNLK